MLIAQHNSLFPVANIAVGEKIKLNTGPQEIVITVIKVRKHFFKNETVLEGNTETGLSIAFDMLSCYRESTIINK